MSDQQSRRMPDTLYHYTSVEALVSMLNDPNLFPESKQQEYAAEKKTVDIDAYQLNFWASHISYLNDPTENQYQLSCLKQALFQYESVHKLPSKSHLLKGIGDFFDNTVGVPFCLSLSEVFNDISMWRSYGNNGTGIIIAFDTTKLVGLNRLQQDIKLSPIEYCSKEELTQSYSNKLLEFLYDNIEVTDGQYKININAFICILKNKKFTYKDIAYQTEKEWRLSVFCQECNCDGYRVKNGLIIPYAIIPIPFNVIKEIMVGPCAQQQLCARSLAGMIRKKTSIESVPIILSDVPYRIM